MTNFPFLSDKKLLLRQAVMGWVVLSISTMVFAGLATVLSFVVHSSDTAVVIALLVVAPMAIGVQLYCHSHKYEFVALGRLVRSELPWGTDALQGWRPLAPFRHQDREIAEMMLDRGDQVVIYRVRKLNLTPVGVEGDQQISRAEGIPQQYRRHSLDHLPRRI